MTDATQLPQVLIITNVQGDHIAFESANQGRFDLKFLNTETELRDYKRTIHKGEFIAVVVGLLSNLRIRGLNPFEIASCAHNHSEKILVVGMCGNGNWREMILRSGATHATTTPAEALDLIANKLNRRG